MSIKVLLFLKEAKFWFLWVNLTKVLDTVQTVNIPSLQKQTVCVYSLLDILRYTATVSLHCTVLQYYNLQQYNIKVDLLTSELKTNSIPAGTRIPRAVDHSYLL